MSLAVVMKGLLQRGVDVAFVQHQREQAPNNAANTITHSKDADTVVLSIQPKPSKRLVRKSPQNKSIR